MTLEEYRLASGLSIQQLADAIGVGAEAARLYLRNKRIPRRDVMLKIGEISKGAVTADSFYRADDVVAEEDASPAEAPAPPKEAAA